MNVNIPAPERAEAAPSFDVTPDAHVIKSDEEAIALAPALAAEFTIDAAERGRQDMADWRAFEQ
ncbi:MAG: hypothetical protein AB7F74_07245 [Parvibaculaceae bacterium]